MGDKGKYRYRRYSVLSWQHDLMSFSLEKHQPHYQDIHYNYLNGGVERHYEPFENNTLGNRCFKVLLEFSTSVFNQLRKNTDWHIEAHQFRIIMDDKNLGFPTPEGIHRDGRHFILMTLIDKVNVWGGETSLYDDNKNKILKKTLSEPTDTLLVHDEKTMHGVTAIKRISPQMKAYRDILVITYIEKSKIK